MKWPNNWKMPDVFHINLGGVDCYIMRSGQHFTTTYKDKHTGKVTRPGDCLDWLIEQYNKDPGAPPSNAVATLHDASELLEHPNAEKLPPPEEMEGYPFK